MNLSEQEPNPIHGKDLSDLISLLERNPEALKLLKEKLDAGSAVNPAASPIPAVPAQNSPPAHLPRLPDSQVSPVNRQVPATRAAVSKPSPAMATHGTPKLAPEIKSAPASSPLARKEAPDKADSAPTVPNAPPPAVPAKQSAWGKIGGGPLTVAVLLHVILLILAAVWIFQIIHPPEKTVDFMPAGGGGGERGAQYNVQQKKRAQIAPSTNVKRVFAEGSISHFSIPDPGNDFGEMSPQTSLAGGGLSGGLGGSGLGSGFGKGSGSGAGSALGGAGNGKLFGPLNLFGQRGGAGLTGTFYDLKQKRDRSPSGVTADTYKGIVQGWVDGGLQKGALDDYFRAPNQLSALQFMMPRMPAEEAPKAYDVEKEVSPAVWVAHYQGRVSPPKSGTYHFVGAADDVLIVRFGGKLVLDGSWEQTSSLVAGQIYKTEYGSHPKGGFARGEAIQVNAGEWYDMDVVIGERPGGFFWACLCIEEEGGRYKTDRADMPLFPLFRLSGGKLPAAKKSNLPPFDPKGPIWKLQTSVNGPALDLFPSYE